MTPLAPPSCPWWQLSLFVDVTYKGRPLVSFTSPGTEWLEKGSFSSSFSSPLVLGKATMCGTETDMVEYLSGDSPSGLPVSVAGGFDPSDLVTRVALVRGGNANNDVGIRKLFDSRHYKPRIMRVDVTGTVREVDYLLQAHPNASDASSVDLSKPQDSNLLLYPVDDAESTHHELSWSFNSSTQAANIIRRCPVASMLRLTPFYTFGIVGKAEVVVFCISVRIHHGPHHGKTFVSKDEVEKHGVSLQHILSEIEGTR